MIKRNKVLAIIVVIAIIVAAITAIGRMTVESKNKQVDIVVDYTEMAMLAEQSEHDLAWYFKEFKEMGISKVGLEEDNLLLIANTEPTVKADIMDVYEKRKAINDIPDEVKAYYKGYDIYDVLVSIEDEDIAQRIIEQLETRYKEERYNVYKHEEICYIMLDGTVQDAIYEPLKTLFGGDNKGYTQVSNIVSSKLLYLSMGLDQEKIDIIQGSGLTVIPRTYSYDGWNDEKFEQSTIDMYKTLDNPIDYLIFAGKEIVGEDDGSELLKEYIKEENIAVGLVETTSQRENIEMAGIINLAEENDYNTVRIFSVWPYIQYRYQYYNYSGVEEIENTFYRAVTERNIRVIYFKPMKYKDNSYAYITDINAYNDLFERFETRIARHGMTIDKASVLSAYTINPIQKAIITIGAIAALFIVFNELIKIKKKYLYGLFVLVSMGVFGLFLVMPRIAELLGALGAAVAYASIAIWYIVQATKKHQERLRPNESLSKLLIIGTKELIITSVIAFCGALSTTTIISDINFLLEIDIFRGVKIAQLFPVLVFMVLYLAYFGFNEINKLNHKISINEIKKLLFMSVKVWMVLLAGVLLVAGYIYIARTGHETNIEPSTIELIFRNFLEETLFARPRTKEFLISFPAIMLFIHTAVRRMRLLPFLFALAAVLGQTSIINTFMHIRTPMYLSLARTGYSLLFGIILGIIYVVLLEICIKIIERIKRGILDA